MLRYTCVLASAVVALALAGCSSGSDSAPTTVTVRETQTSAPSAPSAEQPAPAAESWVMPDLIGQNLQAAQDAIQATTGNPGFFSTSSDLTGQGRMQVMDRNWQVCSSSPPPGAMFTSSTPVDFGVVRDTEACP